MKRINIRPLIAVLFFIAFVFSTSAQRRTVLEIGTGSYLGFCPDIETHRINLRLNNPNAILLECHVSDSMEFVDGLSLANAMFGSYPSGLIDRYKFASESNVDVSRNNWDGIVDEREGMTPIVNVDVINQYWNPQTREVTATLEATFLSDEAGDFRFNLFVVEDSVTGIGPGYDQTNYYNGSVGHIYYLAGDPIIGYVHRNVERAFLGGTWGTQGVIPGTVSNGSTYTIDYSYTLPSNYNENQIYLVPIVQHFSSSLEDREILNANITPLQLSFAGNDELAQNQFNLFPNPTSGVFTLQFEDVQPSVKIILKNNLGQIIANSFYTKTRSIEASIEETKGVYYLEVITESDFQIVKIVKQ